MDICILVYLIAKFANWNLPRGKSTRVSLINFGIYFRFDLDSNRLLVTEITYRLVYSN